MFAKIFTQVLDSSLAENYQVRHVFEDMLKLCDIDGIVDMTHEAIARRTNVPLDVVRHGISELEKPDPKSRNPAHEGRRIVRIDEHRDWGWIIVNYSHYRSIASEDQRREKTRLRTQKWREGNDLKAGDAPVTQRDAGDAMQRQRQRQMQMNPTQGGVDEIQTLKIPKHLNTPKFSEKWKAWIGVRKAMKKPKSWGVLFAEQLEWLSKYSEPQAIEIISTSIMNGWQGLFPPKKQTQQALPMGEKSTVVIPRGNL